MRGAREQCLLYCIARLMTLVRNTCSFIAHGADFTRVSNRKAFCSALALRVERYNRANTRRKCSDILAERLLFFIFHFLSLDATYYRETLQQNTCQLKLVVLWVYGAARLNDRYSVA